MEQQRAQNEVPREVIRPGLRPREELSNPDPRYVYGSQLSQLLDEAIGAPAQAGDAQVRTHPKTPL